jgi:hypothetical protein
MMAGKINRIDKATEVKHRGLIAKIKINKMTNRNFYSRF